MSYHTRVLGEANASGLREFRISPLHYYDWVTGTDKDKTPPMREGTAFHMALHEPERFARTYIEVPKMPLRSKDNRADFVNTIIDTTGILVEDTGGDADALRSSVSDQCAAKGVNVISSESLATLKAMVKSLNHPAHAIAKGMVMRGEKESELRWKDQDSGVQCKALIDSWDHEFGVLFDLKRTDSITARDFRREVYNREYDFQLAWYRRALRAHADDPSWCGFVCGCPSRPYPWAIYEVPVERLDYCDENHSMMLLTLAECMRTQTWPTLNNGDPVTLEMTTR